MNSGVEYEVTIYKRALKTKKMFGITVRRYIEETPIYTRVKEELDVSAVCNVIDSVSSEAKEPRLLLKDGFW